MYGWRVFICMEDTLKPKLSSECTEVSAEKAGKVEKAKEKKKRGKKICYYYYVNEKNADEKKPPKNIYWRRERE